MENALLKRLYKQILALDSFQPSPKVNALFGQLVKIALSTKNQNILSVSEKQKLQIICSQAEYELEKYWAIELLKSKNIQKSLNKFPYFENYQKLTQMEWFSLLSCTNHDEHKVIFVGGGPLPLTAIVLALKYDANVTVLDIDKTACELAESIINKLGLKGKVKIANSDARNFDHYRDFNVVVVAALAGINKNSKTAIMKKIKKETIKGTHVLARSSWGMREILYRPLDQELYKLFTPIVEVRPQNDVVNSLVIFSNE